MEIESREQFQEKVMESSVPVLVDFHARWRISIAHAQLLNPLPGGVRLVGL